MFVFDVTKEHIAVKEANRLSIPVFGVVDTNSNPADVDYVIPANDDALKSIELITEIMTSAIREGLEERKAEKLDEQEAKENKDAKDSKKSNGSRKRAARKNAESNEAEAQNEEPAAEA
jgi:small subunit ribosomal protein S2